MNDTRNLTTGLEFVYITSEFVVMMGKSLWLLRNGDTADD